MRRLVAAQVVDSHLAPHNFARASDLYPLGHGGMRFQFLLHKCFLSVLCEVKYNIQPLRISRYIFYTQKKKQYLFQEIEV